MAEAVARQAGEFGYVSATAFTHGPVEELARELAATLPRGLDKLYFLSSGSEAVEAALKLARQYWIEAGKPGKHRIIALKPSYHGNTLLALSASAREQYQLPFREWLVDVEHIPAPHAYRCGRARADRRRDRERLGEPAARPDILVSPRRVRGRTRRSSAAQARPPRRAVRHARPSPATPPRYPRRAAPRGRRAGAWAARGDRVRGRQGHPR